jgi:signal transduction histidine kinase
LKAERRESDARTRKSGSDDEERAAQVVRRARGRAAQVLRLARKRADQKAASQGTSAAARKLAAAARSRADATLRQEYAHADYSLALERRARAVRVEQSLERMRGETDRSLLVERADADTILSRTDEFLGLISHDLRNELTAIGFGIGKIMKDAPEDDAGRAILRAAKNVPRAGLRMGRLVGDILDIVSIEAGRFTVIPERQDGARVVEEIVETFQVLAVDGGIRLEHARPRGALPKVRFDRHRVLQVLGNLLLNALKFTPAGGRITVGAAIEGNRVRFSVSDTGRGIAPDQLEAIFERYAQGPGAEKRGLGLGLYIARHIIEAHGGTIWAKSSIGRGSTFCFSLPMTVKGDGAVSGRSRP